MIKTFRDLLERLSGLTEEQLESDITLWKGYQTSESKPELFKLILFLYIAGETDILDKGHPCLAVVQPKGGVDGSIP
jgi:hypothetical protein